MGAVRALCALALLAGVFAARSDAFYVTPGFLSPTAFHDNDTVPLMVNKLTSDKTMLTYAYADAAIFCAPAGGFKRQLLNLGEVLRGDRIANSDYQLRMNADESCRVLCTKPLSKSDAEFAWWLIKEDYRLEWLIDNLPSATAYTAQQGTKKKQYEPGFKLGTWKDEKAYIHNHVNLKLYYAAKGPGATAEKYIVGFEVYPKSVAIADGNCPAKVNDPNLPMQQVTKDPASITYTYSVYWLEEKEVNWGNRWDLYLMSSDPQIHWYSIINSMIILLFLTAMVAIIMLRTLNKDIAMYNEEDLKEEQEDTTGWKLVHGDVFRPPRLGGLLSIVVGSGVQFALMILVTGFFAVFGILNPSYRGGLISFALFLFVFMGAFAGYFSSRLYKAFKGTAWKRNAVLTATVVPGSLFAIMFLLNFFVWAQEASNAIPLGTMVVMFLMWLGISLPLVYAGAYYGQKKQVIEHPVRTNQIPRQIPEQVWYLQPGPAILISGLMPFAVAFIELFFLLKSAWSDQYYYLFGFLGLVASILVITVIEIDIVIIYFTLCAENYHWWWRSFMIGGASAVYIFLYALFYYVTRLEISDPVSGMVYFVQALVGCLIYFVSLATIGFLATYLFLIKIYGSIKID
ncbi:transmembrane 9 superfamily member 4-like [Hyaloraphidium curvatum]|nr:transmembrane 9 superfamily member 4-like [Hyaloraphidium curvatum]